MKARMGEKGRKLQFRVGRIGRFLENKKKKPPVRKDKPFVSEIPPACIESILRIRHLMALEYAKEEAMRYMGMRA